MSAKRAILIVDDDSNLRKTLSDILAARGYVPVPVGDGKTALKKVKEQAPAAALIDLRLPDMDGLKVTEAIKKHSPGTECIVLTGYASQDSAIEAVNVGAYSYVKKPYDMDHLLVTIRRAVEKREAAQALRQSEEFNRRIIESSRDCIEVLDLEGRLLFMSQGGQDLLQVEDISPCLNRAWVDSWEGADKEAALEAISRARSGETGGFQGYCPTENGVPKWWDVVITPVSGPDGAVERLLAISRDITERKQAEEGRVAYQAELRSLASELSLAEERERRRIANVLHDEVTQALVLAKIGLESFLGSPSSASAPRTLEEVIQAIGQVIDHMRALTFDLSPPVLYELGLEAAIHYLAEQFQGKHGVSVQFEDDEAPKPLTEDVRVTLYRAVRELLINVVKHARARTVNVCIERDGDNARIKVEDDGVGFDTSLRLSREMSTRGLGLFGIGERMRHLGGRLTLESERGRGTRVMLEAPLARDGEPGKD